MDAQRPLSHLEHGLGRPEVVLPIVVHDVVVMEEEHHDAWLVAVALRLVEEQLLVGAVTGRATVDHLRRAAGADQGGFEDLGRGLGQGHRVALHEGVAEGEDARSARRRLITALGVSQPVTVDRHLDGVLAAAIDDPRARDLAPTEDRVVLGVVEDLDRLLAPTLTTPQETRRHFEDEEREQGRGEDEEDRRETLTDGLRHRCS